MNTFIRICSACDAFSVSFNPRLTLNKNKIYYKSVFGGIASIIIYVFALIFSIDLLMKWFNNNMVMTVSSQVQSYDNSIFKDILGRNNSPQFISISIWWNEEDVINPFQEDEIILLPLMINVTTMEIDNTPFSYDVDDQIRINITNFQQFYNDLIIVFVPCIGNERLLSSDQHCATEEKHNYFWKLTGLEIQFSHWVDLMDIYTKEVNIRYLETNLLLQQTLVQFQKVLYRYSYTEIRSGLPFQQSSFSMLKNQLSESTQVADKNYIDNYINSYIQNSEISLNNICGALYLMSDLSVDHIVAQYPTLSEILASIGSTLQTMLLIKYLLVFMNRSQMIKQFKVELTEIFFPELQQIRQVGIGKQKEYFFEEKKLEKLHYTNFLKYLDKKLEEKLNYTNLIYEISRMQIVLEQISSYKIIVESHLQSPLSFELDQTSNRYKIHSEVNFFHPNNGTQINNQLNLFAFNYSFSKTNIKNLEIERLKSEEVNPEMKINVSPYYCSRSLKPYYSNEQIN